MVPALITLGVLFLLYFLPHLKTSRADGELITNMHPYRKLIPYVMITRNESVVYFDTYVDAAPLLDYLKDAKEHFHCDMTHACVAAGFIGLHEAPSMNYFSHGRRLYRRKDKFITFSMKRQKGSGKAKLATVKQRCEQGMTFRDLCEAVQGKINVERSEKRTYADKEFDLFNLLPRPVMLGAVKLFKWLDFNNILPAASSRTTRCTRRFSSRISVASAWVPATTTSTSGETVPCS